MTLRTFSFIDSFQRYGNDKESYGGYQIRFLASLYNYIFNHYGVEIDRRCRNRSRACFFVRKYVFLTEIIKILRSKVTK